MRDDPALKMNGLPINNYNSKIAVNRYPPSLEDFVQKELTRLREEYIEATSKVIELLNRTTHIVGEEPEEIKEYSEPIQVEGPIVHQWSDGI